MNTTYQRMAATREAPAARDVALLVARLVLAWDFIYHGSGTLFGAFHGTGLHEASAFFANTAHLKPGGFWAAATGIIELLGGIGVLLGILGRLSAAGLVLVMVGAIVTVTGGNGLAAYEINVALAGLAAVIAILGTGRLSLDAVIGARLGTSSTARDQATRTGS